jgi:hypothetical protein
MKKRDFSRARRVYHEAMCCHNGQVDKQYKLLSVLLLCERELYGALEPAIRGCGRQVKSSDLETEKNSLTIYSGFSEK